MLQRLYDWPRRHALVVDGLFAGVLFLGLGLPGILGFSGTSGQSGLVVAALSVVMTLVLVLRRVRPVLTFTVVSLGCLVQLLTWHDVMPADAVFPVAAYALAAHAADRPVRLAGLAVTLVAGPLAAVSWSQAGTGGILFVAASTGGVAVTAWIAGDLMRSRREVLVRLREQNEALLRDQEQRERLAAQQERSRIARDMHDVVAHGLSVIVVQADGAAFAARHAAVWEREQATETLEVLATTARAALAETRHLVGLLRRDDEPVAAHDPAASPAADYAPVAGLADLPGLVERLHDAGLDVRLEADGVDAAGVPTETALAVYRIAQESLTNVLKHGGPGARAVVTLTRGPDGLELRVVDDGRGAAAEPAPRGGSGLVGMRERAAAVGGALRSGPLVEGGYHVHARLPLAEVTA